MATKTAFRDRITFGFYNSFTNESLGLVVLQYNRTKATNSFYSKFWRKWKLFLANEYKIDKHWVRAKISLS